MISDFRVFGSHVIYLPVMLLLAACSSGSDSSSAGTRVDLYAAPSALVATSVTVNPTDKVIANTGTGDQQVTITSAYLVITDANITIDCSSGSPVFSRLGDELMRLLLPTARAHTTSTPTSTGEPFVINIIAADDTPASIGNVSPPTGDYCGVELTMAAADADTANLPGDVDMIGRSLYIEGSYANAGGGGGSFSVDTSQTLLPRNLLFPALISLSAANLNADANIVINYDTWFNGFNLADLASNDPTALGQLYENIRNSLH